MQEVNFVDPTKLNKIIFYSKTPRLRISFKMPRGRRDGLPIPFPALQFNEGRMVLDPGEYEHWELKDYEKLVGLIETHPTNRSQGGKEFWIEDRKDRDAMQLAAGKVLANPPIGGMTLDTHKILSSLLVSSKKFAPAEQPKIYANTCEMMELFKVKGLAKPKEEFTPTRLRARIIEFLGVLEDLKIWEKDSDDGITR